MDKQFFKDCAVDLTKRFCGTARKSMGITGTLPVIVAAISIPLAIAETLVLDHINGIMRDFSGEAIKCLREMAIVTPSMWCITNIAGFSTSGVNLQLRKLRKRETKQTPRPSC